MKYSGIAQAAEELVDILRCSMVPQMIKSKEKIGLCSPSKKEDVSVGIWLYDIRVCEELGEHTMRAVDSCRQRYPSCFLNLYFVITAYSNGDARYQAKEEQLILGKVIQVLQDHAVLETVSGESRNIRGKQICSVHLLNLPMEEKIRIFDSPGIAYKTSLFYELGPIEIESEKIDQTARVVEAQFHVEESLR